MRRGHPHERLLVAIARSNDQISASVSIDHIALGHDRLLPAWKWATKLPPRRRLKRARHCPQRDETNTFRARQDLASAPKTFRFGAPRLEGAEMIYQRYQDADLANAQPDMTRTYAASSRISASMARQFRGMCWRR